MENTTIEYNHSKSPTPTKFMRVTEKISKLNFIKIFKNGTLTNKRLERF